MKKSFFFLLLALAITIGAGAVINETTGTYLHIWSNDTNDYQAKVTAIDSITCVEKMRVWVNNDVAYEKEVDGIDSITFAEGTDPVNPDTIPEDTIQYEIQRGLFSVGEGKQVYFSLGNLQYQASTQTWRFAEHQYDHIGAGNANIADDYDGWIDLFAWGTNPYADDTTSHLRSLTASEWDYLVYTRQIGREDNLSGHAVVNGVTGYILLPDDYEMPEGITFLGSVGAWYKKNKYTLSQWKRMEAAGAIFLPVTGRRENTKVEAPDSYGYYWSSTVDKDNKELAWNLELFADSAPGNAAQIYTVSSNIQLGYAVRLIEPLFIDTIPVNPDTIPVDTIPEPPTPIDCPEGAIPGLFSVAADKRVYFSRGNLQYVDTVWQFAEHQWDYFGKTQSDGHRDLFGWGTGLEPNKVSSDASSYTFFTDWGGNPIANGGNKGFLWETISKEEFKYLFLYREKADSLIGFGTVNGTNGLIILPDEWVLPAGAVFNPSVTMGLVAETYQYNNSNKNNFSHNTYTAEQWAVMERAGAVFLPAAGYRSSSSPSGVGTSGEYWTSTPASDTYPNYAYHTDLDKQYLEFATFNNRNYGRSVRLVQPEVLDTAHQRIRGKFSVAEGKQVYIAPGNLQYRASTDTWRFAEHQYDTIGAGNANIADDYDGWIDLFGWGTGDKPTMRTSTNDYYYYSYHDWGMNPISYPGDTIEHHWRALTYDEWNYLYNERPDYKKLSGHAIIDGIKGFIFLPDDWKLPWGLTFYARTSTWSKNTYTLEQWEKMEDAGAVFLPAAGHRTVAKVSYVNRYGDYWFSSLRTDLEMHSQGFEFYENGDAFSGYKTQIETSTYAASEGIAVRLVEPVEPEVAPEEPEPIPHPEGAIAGLFSVSETKKVYFSQGNLQYKAGTWRFAEHQYDTIGADNQYIGSANMDWIDLFGWGTGNRPMETSTNTGDYIDSYVGWGVNPIINGGNTPRMWATMTSAEWEYLFDGRPNAGKLRGHGCVNGVNGYIFLPDDWQLPYGARFFPNRGQWLGNVYTLEEWAPMERAGAVFLPAAGRRSGTAVSDVNKSGNYWSSSKNEEFSLAGHYYFSWIQNVANPNYLIQENQIQRVSSVYPNVAFSVRLVRPQADSIPGDTLPADTVPEPPTPIDCPEGAVPGLFSVAADKRVYFSKGNLQYIDTIWQFAEHQWDYFGTDQSDGHRDLFGWGTGFTPNMVSRTGTEYWKFVDWGENAISNGGNKENLWQTLTQPEFTYLFFTRENADSLFGLATVNGIKGLIVLPDNWTLPAGLTFVVSTPQDLLDYGCTYKYNSSSNKFSNNTYTAEQWAVMESAGAVFLPTAGYRSNETNVLNVGSYGNYWSATPQINSNSSNSNANCLYFTTETLKTANTSYRNYGRSVRLVQPEILPDTVQKKARHTFSVAESKEVYFSPGNLQYRASTDTWRFAEHQYDTIGAANANISDTYDGWIDLFGWGTGDKPTMSIQDHEYYFYCYHDWGMNPISYPGDTIEHQWRALTSEEWTYLYNTRPNCTHLSGYGKINGVAGYIILPDDWKPREGIEFVGRASSATNTYSLEQWERMEALGAIFLPHAGMRDGTEVNSQRGRYWLSSIEMTFEGCARSLETTNEVGIKNATYTWYGYSVRLIEPVVPEVAPPDPEPIAHPEGAVPGLFSVSENKRVYFSQGNLQYKAGTWRFAEHQYDTIGADNQYILSTNMGVDRPLRLGHG